MEGDAVAKDVNLSAAKVVEREAERRTPVVSGRLRQSGRSSGTKTAGVVRYGRAAVPWAGPVHFGQASRPQGGYVLPNPFLYDAVDSRRQQVFDVYNEHLEKLGRQL